jgi:hypothetical protein
MTNVNNYFQTPQMNGFGNNTLDYFNNNKLDYFGNKNNQTINRYTMNPMPMKGMDPDGMPPPGNPTIDRFAINKMPSRTVLATTPGYQGKPKDLSTVPMETPKVKEPFEMTIYDPFSGQRAANRMIDRGQRLNGWINQQREWKDAPQRIEKMTSAMNVYGTNQNNSRGDWDELSGLLRPDQGLNRMYAQKGGMMNYKEGSEYELDDAEIKRLKKLGYKILES